jgi:septum formation protein
MTGCQCQKKFQAVHSVIASRRTRRLLSSHTLPPLKIILASTSPYRRELLTRLGLEFDVVAPQVDETRHPEEAGEALAARLAEAKARAVAERNRDAVVIGSDQVAVCEGEIYGKPGTEANAIAQLRRLSGRRVAFHTAVCVLRAAANRSSLRQVPYYVHFRRLSDETIARYVKRERPLDCAGSAKAEGLGIALIERLEGDDPTALLGLPLIALVGLLAGHGVEVV